MSPVQNGNVSPSSSPNNNLVLSSPQTPENGKGEERSVINSLKQFTAIESLCASNAYECENCCAPHNNAVTFLLVIIFIYKFTFSFHLTQKTKKL